MRKKTMIAVAVGYILTATAIWLISPSIFQTLLGWSGGIILGNLLASAVWAAPAMSHLHAKIDKQHQERIDLANQNHQDMKNHIENLIGENK